MAGPRPWPDVATGRNRSAHSNAWAARHGMGCSSRMWKGIMPRMWSVHGSRCPRPGPGTAPDFSQPVMNATPPRLAVGRRLRDTRRIMDVIRRLFVVLLCLGIAFTGRGPVTELASPLDGHEHGNTNALHSARSIAAGEQHAFAAHRHGNAVAHMHVHKGADDGGSPQCPSGAADDSCACGCGMGSCAAMPADFLMHHPELARIELRIDLPAPRTAVHSPSPMAPLLRPPIG